MVGCYQLGKWSNHDIPNRTDEDVLTDGTARPWPGRGRRWRHGRGCSDSPAIGSDGFGLLSSGGGSVAAGNTTLKAELGVVDDGKLSVFRLSSRHGWRPWSRRMACAHVRSRWSSAALPLCVTADRRSATRRSSGARRGIAPVRKKSNQGLRGVR
jgi:hypothetical protein